MNSSPELKTTKSQVDKSLGGGNPPTAVTTPIGGAEAEVGPRAPPSNPVKRGIGIARRQSSRYNGTLLFCFTMTTEALPDQRYSCVLTEIQAQNSPIAFMLVHGSGRPGSRADYMQNVSREEAINLNNVCMKLNMPMFNWEPPLAPAADSPAPAPPPVDPVAQKQWEAIWDEAEANTPPAESGGAPQ